ncbi:MAG: hypothetical protein E7K54_10110, partial [Corynebacterium sp.]|nr:hypothetical protein [Corynebacterium sp.]
DGPHDPSHPGQIFLAYSRFSHLLKRNKTWDTSLGVTMNPALVARVAEVGGTGNMVTSMHTGVITMGVTVGTAISSLVIEKNNGVASYSGLVSVILVIMACLLTVMSLRQKDQNV